MSVDLQAANATDLAIGTALRGLREARGMTARQLATDADVSPAMVSRIENGQVSPSISTLSALSAALEVPLVSLFRNTAAGHSDFTHVKQGEGLKSTRLIEGHSHEFTNLALHARRDLRFEAHMVTLLRKNGKPPRYGGHGVLFIHVKQGEAVFRYGPQEMVLGAGDSLSLDAELSHGFVEVISEKLVFLSVQAAQR